MGYKEFKDKAQAYAERLIEERGDYVKKKLKKKKIHKKIMDYILKKYNG